MITPLMVTDTMIITNLFGLSLDPDWSEVVGVTNSLLGFIFSAPSKEKRMVRYCLNLHVTLWKIVHNVFSLLSVGNSTQRKKKCTCNANNSIYFLAGF